MGKWMGEYLEYLKTLDNDDLFQEFKDNIIPDGVDYNHTSKGNWLLVNSHHELEKRLKSINFLR